MFGLVRIKRIKRAKVIMKMTYELAKAFWNRKVLLVRECKSRCPPTCDIASILTIHAKPV